MRGAAGNGVALGTGLYGLPGATAARAAATKLAHGAVATSHTKVTDAVRIAVRIYLKSGNIIAGTGTVVTISTRATLGKITSRRS